VTALPKDVEIRPLVHDDLQAAEPLCRSVHGFERTNELRDALGSPALQPFAALREGRLVAYATTLTFFPAAYAVAETEQDLAALIAGALARGDAPASFLLPTRQHELLRWCLRAGLRVVKPMDDLHGARRVPTPARRLDPVRALLTGAGRGHPPTSSERGTWLFEPTLARPFRPPGGSRMSRAPAL
jgi:hypothetical protein